MRPGSSLVVVLLVIIVLAAISLPMSLIVHHLLTAPPPAPKQEPVKKVQPISCIEAGVRVVAKGTPWTTLPECKA